MIFFYQPNHIRFGLLTKVVLVLPFSRFDAIFTELFVFVISTVQTEAIPIVAATTIINRHRLHHHHCQHLHLATARGTSRMVSPTTTPTNLPPTASTAIATLLARATDALVQPPSSRLLNDPIATTALANLSLPPSEASTNPTARTRAFNQVVLLRARHLDSWTREFLTAHPRATVLHLACGLDSRAWRVFSGGSESDLAEGSSSASNASPDASSQSDPDLDLIDSNPQGATPGDSKPNSPEQEQDHPPRQIRWIEVDVPSIISLRSRVLPAPPFPSTTPSSPSQPAANQYEYTLLPTDVTSPRWLESLPAGNPTLIIMEGLLMYLTRSEATTLIQRICSHFGDHGAGGQIICDVVGRRFLATQGSVTPIARTGAVMRFAVDGAGELARMHERLRVRDQVGMWERPGRELCDWYMRWSMWIWSWIPGVNTMGLDLRLDF